MYFDVLESDPDETQNVDPNASYRNVNGEKTDQNTVVSTPMEPSVAALEPIPELTNAWSEDNILLREENKKMTFQVKEMTALTTKLERENRRLNATAGQAESNMAKGNMSCH